MNCEMCGSELLPGEDPCGDCGYENDGGFLNNVRDSGDDDG